MDMLSKTYRQLFDLYGSMSPGARLRVGLLTAALLGMGCLLACPEALPKVELMPGLRLSAGQLPAMQAAWADAGLKQYELRGTSVFVPLGQQADYMAALAKANALPRSLGDPQRDAIDGGTVFDLGPQRELRSRIAKQDVLAQGICKIRGIDSAYVLVDEDPRPGAFKDKVITASVMVAPTEAKKLDVGLVASIRRLVAASIAGLKPEDVAVADLTTGRTWYGNLENEPAAALVVEPAAATPAAERRVEPTAPTPMQLARQWFGVVEASWRTWAAVVLGLVGLWLLWSMVHGRPAAAEEVDASPVDEPAVVPAPHAERFFEPDASLREELLELVEDDPDAAAKVLRSWIGEVS